MVKDNTERGNEMVIKWTKFETKWDRGYGSDLQHVFTHEGVEHSQPRFEIRRSTPAMGRDTSDGWDMVDHQHVPESDSPLDNVDYWAPTMGCLKKAAEVCLQGGYKATWAWLQEVEIREQWCMK